MPQVTIRPHKESSRQGPARRATEQEAFLLLQKTADELMTGLADLLKPYRISPTQYNVLRILRGAGAVSCWGGHPAAASEGLSCGQIAERMLTHDPDVTRLLDRLEDRRLVERQREKADRRMITTRISASGLELLRGLDRPLLDLHRRQLGHVGRRKLAELVALLSEIRSPQQPPMGHRRTPMEEKIE